MLLRVKSKRLRSGIPNLSLTMYPFSISTDEQVPLKFLMTKRLSETKKSTEFLMELLYFRIFGNNHWINIFILLLPIFKCTVAIGKSERQVRKASHWQQAAMEITCHDQSIIACSRHVYLGVVLRAHPVRGESHNQHNAKRRGCNNIRSFPIARSFLWRLQQYHLPLA